MKALEMKYIAFIDERITEHNRVGEQYKADERKDEADLEKIKANINEVFKTLFLSDIKQLEGKNLAGIEDIAIYGGFLQRFETIPTNWKVSLDKAIENGDTTKQVIEEHKLEVANELKERFLTMFDKYRR